MKCIWFLVKLIKANNLYNVKIIAFKYTLILNEFILTYLVQNRKNFNVRI